MHFKLLLITIAFLLFIRLGFFYFSPLPIFDNQTVAFQTVLLEDPKIVGNTQTFSVRYGTFWQSISVRISTGLDREYSYGQTVAISGTVKRKLLKNKQAYFAIQNPQIEAKNSGFLPIFGSLRGKIIAFCENNFSQPYSGLLVGIIFGIKSLLTQQITTSFRITGISHVVAASGMNVTLVAGFLFSILGSFLKRRVAVGISLLGILFYVCLSGFDASIVRAALMGGIAFSATLFGRQYSGLYTLFLVGAAMLLWDPLLLTDVGFQLSILATVGILVLKPSLFRSEFLSDDVGATLAAQAATLPVLLATFGQYSLLSVVANILILWTIPLIMTVGGVGILIGLVFAPLGKIIVLLIIPLLWYMKNTALFFSMHSVSVQISSLPIAFVIGYYFLLLSFLLFVKHKKTS